MRRTDLKVGAEYYLGRAGPDSHRVRFVGDYSAREFETPVLRRSNSITLGSLRYAKERGKLYLSPAEVARVLGIEHRDPARGLVFQVLDQETGEPIFLHEHAEFVIGEPELRDGDVEGEELPNYRAVPITWTAREDSKLVPMLSVVATARDIEGEWQEVIERHAEAIAERERWRKAERAADDAYAAEVERVIAATAALGIPFAAPPRASLGRRAQFALVSFDDLLKLAERIEVPA